MMLSVLILTSLSFDSNGNIFDPSSHQLGYFKTSQECQGEMLSYLESEVKVLKDENGDPYLVDRKSNYINFWTCESWNLEPYDISQFESWIWN